jgi:hypothetical protein
MPLYNATAFFQMNGYGWTETYTRDSGSTEDLRAMADFDRNNLWMKRAAALGVEAEITAQRVSLVELKGDSVLNYIPLSGNAAIEAEDPSTAILVRCGNALNTRRKNVFCRGVADVAITKGGKLKGDPVFTGAFTAFLAALVQHNYGWMGVDVKTEMSVTNYTQVDSGRVSLVFDPANFPVLATGDKVVWYGKGNGVSGKSVLNGPHPLIKTAAANTMETAKAMAVFPYPGPGGKFVRKTVQFIGIANAVPQKVDIRKAGKPSNLQVGRAAVRARG